MDMAAHHTEVGLSKRMRRLKWSNVNVQKVVVTLTFLFVPLFLLVLFTYLPFFKMVQFSFYDMKYIGARKFVGLQNYVDVFTRDDCFNALKLSLYYMVGSVVQLHWHCCLQRFSALIQKAETFSAEHCTFRVWSAALPWDSFSSISIPTDSCWTPFWACWEFPKTCCRSG